MKKIFITAILLIATGGVLYAQTKQVNKTPGTCKSNPRYVDSNKNNLCDTYDNSTGNTISKRQVQGCRTGKGLGKKQCRYNMQCNGVGGQGRG